MPDLRCAFAVLAVAFATLAAAQQEPRPIEPPPSPALVPQPGPPPATPVEPPTTAQPSPSPPTATATVATPRGSEGVTIAVRAAWLKPHGLLAGTVGSDSEVPLDKEFSSGTQLTVEAGYRFHFGVTAAVFLQYGFVSPRAIAGGGLCETMTCDDGRTLKYGVEVLYHFLRDRPLSPFIGAGFGFERSGYDVSDSTGSATIRYEGIQYLDAQLGADYAVSPHAFVGAFVANSFGRYDKAVVTGSGLSIAGDIVKKRTHDWLQVGLRVRYDL